jgi:uroporphyrinogen decarboxylase
MTSRERVDRAIAGKDVDRPPFTLWHHFHLEAQGPKRHAERTLAFHRDYSTDLVKVMSDFAYPKGSGANWYELKPVAKPFPQQLEALQIIQAGLGGQAHFVETIFNPYNVAEKLSSPADVKRLMKEKPDKLLAALEAIAQSEVAHARAALAAGASGIFLAIANAQDGLMTKEEYRKFSEPFDRTVLAAAQGAPLNVLHLHGPKVYLDLFWKGWPAAAINYSMHETGVPLAQARRQFAGVLLGGIDQRNYRTRSVADLKKDIANARSAAGAKLIVTPGCSVPDESTPEELKKLAAAIG